jgi:hypothetical protein
MEFGLHNVYMFRMKKYVLAAVKWFISEDTLTTETYGYQKLRSWNEFTSASANVIPVEDIHGKLVSYTCNKQGKAGCYVLVVH